MFDAEAIKELTKAEAISAADDALSVKVGAVTALPNDYSIHDLEKFLPNRRRIRGTMATTNVTHFAYYSVDQKEEGATVFVNQDSMIAVAVLNLGTPEVPGHADNRAQLETKKTAAYNAMLNVASGRALKQTEVAEFLEDWPGQLQCFNDQGGVTLPKAIAAVRKITIEAMRKQESSEQQLSASKSAFESVQATSSEPLPTTIYFSCVPYHGLSLRQFVLRLGVQTSGEKPAITLRVVNAEQHAEDMATELVGLVVAEIGESMPVLIGQYQKST